MNTVVYSGHLPKSQNFGATKMNGYRNFATFIEYYSVTNRSKQSNYEDIKET